MNITADRQRQDLPGALPNSSTFFPFTLANPRETNTGLDWGNHQDVNVTSGFTAPLGSGADLIVDGGVRRKFQQSTFYNYFNPPFFVFDESTAVPSSFINTGMTTSSLTPRLEVSHQLFGVSNRLLTGLDLYNTQYDSDRYSAPGTLAIHHYNIRQTTAGYYAMNTMSIRPDTDLSFGGRLQRNMIKADDAYNAAVDPNTGSYATNPQAPPLSSGEWQYAAHLGAEYRANSVLTLFGRAARAFRLPNADERLRGGNPFGFIAPANFDLKTQTSYDVESGFRLKWTRLQFESTAYVMELNNEIHFLPALQRDVNLDPTQRVGWENSATYQVADDIRVRGGVAYTHATFRDGQFTGNDVPLVSRWSGNGGVGYS